MKTKLIKKGDVYFLDELKIDGYFTIANSLAKPNGLMYNLSKKNCQAIERDYDLNELGMDYASTIYDGRTELTRFNGAKVDFIKGFQKAVELMGDKKFSEKDVRRSFSAGLSIGYGRQFEIENRLLEIDYYMQSLQQTEWDVKVEMGGYRFNDDGEKIGFPSYELPKLDADGCLILKPFKSE